MIKNAFSEETTRILNEVAPCGGTVARLANRLCETQARLDALIDQANAQFIAGDRYATFNRQTIDLLCVEHNLSLNFFGMEKMIKQVIEETP